MSHDRTIVDPAGEFPQPVGHAADGLPQILLIHTADVDQPVDIVRTQFSGGDRPHAPQRVHRQPLKEWLDAIG